MKRPPAAPMPAEIRHFVRAPQHPARAVDCPHCGAHDRGPCMSRTGRRRMPEPHPARIARWVRETAVCPTCQVTHGVPCHLDGRELPGGNVHPARHAEAERVAA